MQRLTYSLRVQKLRGDSLKGRQAHNRRNASDKFDPKVTYRSDRERLHLNTHWENEKYTGVENVSDLWIILDDDYDSAKKNKTTKRKKRIPRTTPRRNSTPIETSISREIFLQIGAVEDNYVVPLQVYMHFIKWLQTIFYGDIIRWDIHDDESIRHLHIIATTWNLEHHENYTRNSIIDNYEVFQYKTYKELKSFCKQFDIEILATNPKEETGDIHVSPRTYEREILPAQRAKEKVLHETEIAEEYLMKVYDDTKIAKANLNNILTQAKNAEENSQKKEKEHQKNIMKLIAHKENVEKSIKEHMERGTQKYKDLQLNLSAIEAKIKSKTQYLESLSKKVEEQAQKLIQSFAKKIQSMGIELLETSLEKLRSSNPKPSIKIIRDIETGQEDHGNDINLKR